MKMIYFSYEYTHTLIHVLTLAITEGVVVAGSDLLQSGLAGQGLLEEHPCNAHLCVCV